MGMCRSIAIFMLEEQLKNGKKVARALELLQF
jgi:hypothetical protein